MPGEIEVPLEHAQEHIEDVHEELHGEKAQGDHSREKNKEKDAWTRFIAGVAALLGGFGSLHLPFAF